MPPSCLVFRGAHQEALARVPAVPGDPYSHHQARLLRAAWSELSTAAQETQAVAEAAARLLRKREGSGFARDLLAYTSLLDAQITGETLWDEYHHASPWMRDLRPPDKPRAIPSELLEDDLTDWVFSFRELGRASAAHAMERWRVTRGVPWLVLALAKAEPGDPGLGNLLDASGSREPAHPAFPMAAFHRARLRFAGPRPEAARQELDPLIVLGEGTISPSAMNLARALRVRIARSRGELIQDLLRVPAGVEWPMGEEGNLDPWKGGDARLAKAFADGAVGLDHPRGRAFFQAYGARPAFLEDEGAWILNEQVPTSVLVTLARESATPSHLRRDWLRCAWVRALLTGQMDLALAITPELQGLEPQLAADLEAFRRAPAPERSIEGLWILLRTPGLRWFVAQGLDSRTYRAPGQNDTWDWRLGGSLRSRHPFRDNGWPSPAEFREGENRAFWQGPKDPYAPSSPHLRLFGRKHPAAPAFLEPAEIRQAA